MSELVREALRHYERQRWWEETNAYGRARAAAAGVGTENDVVRVIHEYRQEQRRGRKSGSHDRHPVRRGAIRRPPA